MARGARSDDIGRGHSGDRPDPELVEQADQETVHRSRAFPSAGGDAPADQNRQDVPPPSGTPAGHGKTDSPHADASETIAPGTVSGRSDTERAEARRMVRGESFPDDR